MHHTTEVSLYPYKAWIPKCTKWESQSLQTNKKERNNGSIFALGCLVRRIEKGQGGGRYKQGKRERFPFPVKNARWGSPVVLCKTSPFWYLDYYFVQFWQAVVSKLLGGVLVCRRVRWSSGVSWLCKGWNLPFAILWKEIGTNYL